MVTTYRKTLPAFWKIERITGSRECLVVITVKIGLTPSPSPSPIEGEGNICPPSPGGRELEGGG